MKKLTRHKNGKKRRGKCGTSLAKRTIAAPMGCSLFDSALPISSANRWAESWLGGKVVNSLTTRGFPSVIVPVLSNTTVLICASNVYSQSAHIGLPFPTFLACSNGSPPLIRMPFRAPTPVPTIMAVGVARPSEQGQAMDNTVIAYSKATRKIHSQCSTHIPSAECGKANLLACHF